MAKKKRRGTRKADARVLAADRVIPADPVWVGHFIVELEKFLQLRQWAANGGAPPFIQKWAEDFAQTLESYAFIVKRYKESGAFAIRRCDVDDYNHMIAQMRSTIRKACGFTVEELVAQVPVTQPNLQAAL